MHKPEFDHTRSLDSAAPDAAEWLSVVMQKEQHIQAQEQQITDQQHLIAEQRKLIALLRERLQLARLQRFGPSSEKLPFQMNWKWRWLISMRNCQRNRRPRHQPGSVHRAKASRTRCHGCVWI